MGRVVGDFQLVIAKKFVAAGAGSLSMLLTSGCVNNCSRSQSEYDPGSQVILESRIQNALNDIGRSTFFLKVAAEYVPFLSSNLEEPSEGEPTPKSDDNKVSVSGTAFAYYRDENFTYLITAAHVVSPPPFRMDENLNLQRLKSESVQLSLADNQLDKDESDDIVLELIKTYEDVDISIIRAKNFLHVSTAYDALETNKLRAGEEVYVPGFPYGMTRFVSTGKIGSMDGVPHFKAQKFSCPILLAAETAPGHSGSPVFVRRGDRLYFAGIVLGLRDYITFVTGKSCLDSEIPVLGKGR
ncbi:trypsin-like peptidase domain-containing protein [Candidatus Woesearchaeota archaeon]|nr:trypsin-like peptidase domain-containing protein [Candidatus Woesearchaeota archaeon]